MVGAAAAKITASPTVMSRMRRGSIEGELIDDEQRGVRHIGEPDDHFAQPIADRLRPVDDHRDRIGARCGRAWLGGVPIQIS
jgi:hypothetical protein